MNKLIQRQWEERVSLKENGNKRTNRIKNKSELSWTHNEEMVLGELATDRIYRWKKGQ